MVLIACYNTSGLRMTNIQKAENANYQPSKKLKIETHNYNHQEQTIWKLQGMVTKAEFSLKAKDSQP